MKVVTFNCDSKIREGRAQCGLDGDYRGGLTALRNEPGPILAVWHGEFGEGIDAFLSDDSKRYVLLLGESIRPINDHDDLGRRFPNRLRSFQLGRQELWENHPLWKRLALVRFFRAVLLVSTTVPPWTFLSPRSAPEFVISCYLCTLAGIKPESAWETDFQQEVSFWSAEAGRESIISWEDRADAAKLRAFLANVGALAVSSGNRMGDAGV